MQSPSNARDDGVVQQPLKILRVSRGRFRHKPPRVGKMDFRTPSDAGKIHARIVAKPGQTIARAATIGIDEGNDLIGSPHAFDEMFHRHSWVVDGRLNAREKKDVHRISTDGERPKNRVLLQVRDSRAQSLNKIQQILPDHTHHLPERISRKELNDRGESPQQRVINWRTQLAEDRSLDAQPTGGFERAATIEPFGRLEPFTEFTGVFVQTQILENQRERAGRRQVIWKLVMIEIVEGRIVKVANINHASPGIREVR